jgi:uncharacterized membrane protein
MLVTIVALLVRVVGLERRSIWFDEAVTYVNALAPWSSLLDAARADVHPPLTYALYHLWPLVDAGDAWLRLPSAVLGAAAAPLAWGWARRLAGERVALATGLFAALSPFLVDLSQEARMYGLLLLLTAASMLALDRLLERPRWGRAAVYAALGAGLLYTHYYGALLLAAQGAAALLALVPRWRTGVAGMRWLVSTGDEGSAGAHDGRRANAVNGPLWALGSLTLAGVLFLPWLPSLFGQVGGVREDYWIEPPRPALAWITFRALVAHTPPDYELGIPLRVAYVSIVGLIGLGSLRALAGRRQRAAVSLLLAPPLLALLVSELVLPVYVLRYLSPIGIAFGFLGALGAFSLPRRWLKVAAIGVLFFPPVVSLPSLYLDPGYSRPDLRAAARYAEAQRQADEVVVHLGPFTEAPFDYYGVAPPSAVMVTNERSELCNALDGHAGGWLVTAYAVDVDDAATEAEAGITGSYAGDLVAGPPFRALGVSVFRLWGGC